MKKLKLKLWDEYDIPIASAKGNAKELGEKTKSWMEKFK